MGAFFRQFFRLVADVIFLLTCLIPKDKNTWIFGAWFGEGYTDNSKYLFEYVSNNHHNIRAIWLTKNRSVCEFVTNRGYEACMINTPRGILLKAKSGIWVVSSGILDLNYRYPWIIGRVKIVELWHGSPLKKLHDDGSEQTARSHLAHYRLEVLPFNEKLNEKFCSGDLYIAASEEVRDKIALEFRVPLNMVKITGYPRTDAFFKPDKEQPPITNDLHDLKKSNIVGIYMPTVRGDGQTSIHFLIGDLKNLQEKLAELSVVLFIKLHFFHLNELDSLVGKFDNIRFITEADINGDIYTLLPDTDFLITDYSSVYFDYLLLNKPIIFAPFDIERYIAVDRGMHYKYEEVTPGPKARNWDELIVCIGEISKRVGTVTSERDPYERERNRVSCIFNTYSDGNSSRRVYEAIVPSTE